MKIRGALLAVKPAKQISERFKLQEFYLDCSNYNGMTGEKYDNYCLLQVANDKIDLEPFQRGQLLEVEFFLNGRFFQKREGGSGFMQNLNAAKIEPVLNTADEKIFFSEEQLGNVQIPE